MKIALKEYEIMAVVAHHKVCGIDEQFIKNESCDLDIDLSDLGNQYSPGYNLSDEILSKQIQDIDLTKDGYSLLFSDQPVAFKNKEGDDTMVNQAGFAGIIRGCLVFGFSKFYGKKMFKNHFISVSQKTVS